MTKKLTSEEKELLEGWRFLKAANGLGYVINIDEEQRLALIEVLKSATLNGKVNRQTGKHPLASWVDILTNMPQKVKTFPGGIFSLCITVDDPVR